MDLNTTMGMDISDLAWIGEDSSFSDMEKTDVITFLREQNMENITDLTPGPEMADSSPNNRPTPSRIPGRKLSTKNRRDLKDAFANGDTETTYDTLVAIATRIGVDASDPRIREQIKKNIKDLQRQKDAAAVRGSIIIHDMEVAIECGDMELGLSVYKDEDEDAMGEESDGSSYPSSLSSSAASSP